MIVELVDQLLVVILVQIVVSSRHARPLKPTLVFLLRGSTCL